LVSHEGQLVGLVTVKDVLRYEAAIAHREAKPTVSEPRDRNHSMASSHGWHDARASVGVGEESTNGLELTLEEAFAWARIRGSRVYDVFEGLVRRARGRPRETGHEAAYELGMTEERRDNG